MSGHPLRNPTDENRYRKDYLAYLDLQIDNNEKNLQANLLHRRTGQVASQITDYSTTSQKLANIYALRIELKKQLRRICVAEDADLVVQGLNDAEVRFAINYIEKLVAELRPKFKYGAPEPYVSQYIRRVYDIEQESQGLPNDDVLRAIAGRMGQLPTKNDLEDIGQLLIELNERTSREYLDPIRDDIKETTLILDLIGEILTEISDKPNIDPELLPSIQRIVLDSTQDLPTLAQVRGLLTAIEKVKGDNDRTRQLLADLHQLLSHNPADIEILQRSVDGLHQEVRGQRGITEEGFRNVRGELGGIREEQVYQGAKVKRAVDEVSRAITALEDRLNIKMDAEQIRVVEEGVRNGVSLAEIIERLSRLEEGQIRPERGIRVARIPAEVAQGPPGLLPFPIETTSVEYRGITTKAPIVALVSPYIAIIQDVPPPETNDGRGLKKWYKANYVRIKQEYDAQAKGATSGGAEVGKGLRKIKGKGVKVDESLGVKSNLKFAPFGRYIINLAKLNDDIVRLCRKNGTNISNCKTERVSPDLANVIRKIVNGGKPSFNDITALNEEDRHKYNEYIRKSEIIGEGIEVPQMDDRKDLNQFEIMKGEILSGNDSTELIKKFKTLIVKLVHNGRLPKGQAKELLMDLASLGY